MTRSGKPLRGLEGTINAVQQVSSPSKETAILISGAADTFLEPIASAVLNLGFLFHDLFTVNNV